MTYKRALELSILLALGYGISAFISGYLLPNTLTATTTILDSWIDRVYFSTIGIFLTVWSAKHDNP